MKASGLRLPFAGALLLAVSLVEAGDALPGRLFHTPAQRAALDRSTRPGPARAAPAPRRPAVRAVDPARSPELSGFVLRSDGRDSYWIGTAPAGAR